MVYHLICPLVQQVEQAEKNEIVNNIWKYHFALIIVCIFIIFPACDYLPDEPAVFTLHSIKGITLADWTPTGYTRASAETSLNTIASTGATHLAIIVTAYQSGRTSNEIQSDPLRTPTITSIRFVLTKASTLGLKVVLKPHVELYDKTWRGHINPSNPEKWFASYNNFILPLASLAESLGAVHFIIGTELAGTIKHKSQWEETIQLVKSRFSGKIIYAASWDEADKITFWNNVDYVGIDFYFPVTNRLEIGRFDILANWQPWLDRLYLLHKQTNRKIIITEIGYRSVDGAGMRPYDYDYSANIDLVEQADLYWAALQAAAKHEWIAGMFWWNWQADGSGGPLNSDYTPYNKPAHIELVRSWKQ